MPLPFDPSQQALQGLQGFSNPALTYQNQLPDRRNPAMDQTWGPYLDILHEQGGKLAGGASPAGSNQMLGTSMQPGSPMGASPTPTTSTPTGYTPTLAHPTPQLPSTPYDDLSTEDLIGQSAASRKQSRAAIAGLQGLR